MKSTVHFGFSIIILIMITLAFVWLGQIKSANEKVLSIIEEHDEKHTQAHIMHHAIRTRQNLLFSMLETQGMFELDEKITNFYEAAYKYREARKSLLSLPMNDDEREFHRLIDERALKSQPVNIRAVEMFREDKDKKEILEVIHLANNQQEKLINAIKNFVLYQESRDKEAILYSRKMLDDSVFWISLIGLFGFILSFFISRYVGNSVAEKNRLLSKASDDMSVAYNKAEEATKIKSEFLATMSHEIRTPLTAIIGFAETTLYSGQSKEQRLHSIQTIIRSGKHLLQVVNDILDLSKVEANKLDLDLATVSLFELLGDIELFEKPFAEEKQLTFSVNYTYPLPSKINADGLRIKQILLNLCNNALKFTESGYVSVNVKSEDGSIIFEIIDSGVGISQEQQSIIFQAYRQADSSTTRKFGGTGLGLSLSKLLAERMGGSLSVVSELGKGSQFKLCLPYESLPDEEIVKEASKISNVYSRDEPVMVSGGLSGRVLLAEDNIDNQDLFLIFLERVGVDVTIVEDGKLAVEATKENDFDLILMDMRMPVMGGLEATKLIREQGFKKTIIAVTANAMQEDREDCFKAGCDDFLTKPIDSKLLNNTLEKYLDIKAVVKQQRMPILSSLLEQDPGMIKLVKRFVASMEATIENIEKLINEMDWSELVDALHKLKGTSGNFGYLDVSDLAAQMEFQAVNHSQDDLLKLLDDLKENFQKMLLGIKDR